MSNPTEKLMTFEPQGNSPGERTSDAIYQFVAQIGPQLDCPPGDLAPAMAVALARIVRDMSKRGRRKEALLDVSELLLSYLKPGSPLMEGEPIEKVN